MNLCSPPFLGLKPQALCLRPLWGLAFETPSYVALGPGCWYRPQSRAVFHAVDERTPVIEIHPRLQMTLYRHPAELVRFRRSFFQKSLSQNALDHLIRSSTCAPSLTLNRLDEVVTKGKQYLSHR